MNGKEFSSPGDGSCPSIDGGACASGDSVTSGPWKELVDSFGA